MKANPTYHILVNTMRASYPALVEGHTYRVMVENEKQREELETHMQPLLATLRDATANDHISIIIELNQGEASPPTHGTSAKCFSTWWRKIPRCATSSNRSSSP